MEKLLILDSNSLFNRAFYAMPNFSNRKGQFTGAIFGYLGMLIRLIEKYKPNYVVAAFDRHAPTFRKELYKEYKAQRKSMPQEMAVQLEPLKEIIRAMEIPIVELDGYEADDIIGTIAKKNDIQTYIVTGDKDSLQLIDDTTTILLTKKGVSEIEEYTIPHLKEEGLRPSQIIDLKSLMGDKSDNIPGVEGVGEKTARDLLAKYDTLDGVYKNIDNITGKLKEKLELNKDMAYLSYKLATINIDTPINLDVKKDAVLKMPFDALVRDLLKDLELNKIIEKLEFVGESKIVEEPVDIINVKEIGELDDLILKIKNNKSFSIVLGNNVEIALSKNESYIVEISNNLLEGFFFDDFVFKMKDVFESNEITKIIFDVKNVKHELSEYNIKVNPQYEDVLLMAYLTDANRNFKSLDDLILTYNIASKSKAASLYLLKDIIMQDLKDKNSDKLYYDIEKPLIEVLYAMEQEGFMVDKEKIKELSEKFCIEIEELKKEMYSLVGINFNPNSPKQLANVLFEQLCIPYPAKAKNGSYSTGIEILQEIQFMHPIVPLIMRFRDLEKLRSTYLDGMLPLIEKDGKIHTIFKQTVTATGRLSSTEPNLQNIPVRKDDGKKIRELFISSKDRVLVCADYSQIELRLMAAFSKDESMIDAFNLGEDIHATTASKIFHTKIENVSSDLRRKAKAVNFGIIYGISDFGLSRDMNISIKEAKQFIQNYFEHFPKVHAYMDKLIEDANKKGYAVTLMGRRRYIPELTMSNRSMREFGKRVAMNMPLQGSASDIIKLAMIKVFETLNKKGLKSKLIMQVHDELIIDTYLDEIEEVKTLLKDSMENIMDLKVKLEAEIGVGKNWLEAK